RYSKPCRRPHIPDVNILISIIIGVEPAGAHACPNILDMGFPRDGCECSVAIVAIEIAASEIVGHAEVWPSVGIQIAPGAGETVAVVVEVQSGLIGSILKGVIAFVVKQEVRRAIAGVEVRSRIVILIKAHVVVVDTEIDVETSVTVVIGYRGLRETPLSSPGKLESIALDQIFSFSLIQKAQGTAL